MTEGELRYRYSRVFNQQTADSRDWQNQKYGGNNIDDLGVRMAYTRALC